MTSACSDLHMLVNRSAASVQSLAVAAIGAERLAATFRQSLRAGQRGYFTPEEDTHIRMHFGQYLTARAGLLQTIDELRPLATGRDDDANVDEELRIRAFIVAYTAACILVKAARFMLETARRSPVIRAKLDEADPTYGIPRKQFTSIYRSMLRTSTAFALADAIDFADRHREEIDHLRDDSSIGPVVRLLDDCEDALRMRKRDYVRARLRYRIYSWKRRQRSAYRRTMFGLFEACGRVIADMRNPFHRKRVHEDIQRAIEALLEPGDVLITRHDDAMSNLFLPGFWPHAAFHIGLSEAMATVHPLLDPGRLARWSPPRRVLEARKDGVLLRTLDDTLRVDSVAIIRPDIGQDDLARAIARALAHEGKLYDFEFDFSRADRLVCTEVVYRAFDGIGPMRFELKRRAGRLTFSAEDLLDLAISGNGFHPVAVFGVPGLDDRLVTGAEVSAVLEKSYRT